MVEELDFLDGRGKIKFLDDKLEFYCELERSGYDCDLHKSGEISYASISALLLEPKNLKEFFGHYHHFKRFVVNVPKINRTIVFFVTRSYDSDIGKCYNESLHGPYLSRKENG